MSEEVTLLAPKSEDTAPPADDWVEEQKLERGTAVGRYVVVSHLGSGGMGHVYAAYDPKLDRKLALKLLARRRLSDPTNVERLQREAQAMARLTHPNVVTIHDVGEHEGQVFLAMEFVEGVTLRHWLQERERGWAEIVDVFRAAGRGLAAAHEAGLVHRDFKPDNVMVGAEGRVLVMDFGLARTSEGAPPDQTDSGSIDEEVDSSGNLTAAGSLIGTPAYMAPEQFDNTEVGPASDQFSFCAALYEALFEARPFEGESLPHLVTEVKAGRMRPIPGNTRVPKWLGEVVRQGLDVDPQQRHPSMAAVLTRLDRGRGRGRTWVYAIAAALTVTAAVGITLAATSEQRRCRSGKKKIAQTWNPERSETIAAAYAALPLPYAAATWAKAPPQLDDFAERWSTAYYEACAATRIDGQQSGQRLDQRMDCLSVAQAHLGSLLTEFESPDEVLVERTLSALKDLPKPEDCAESQTLEAHDVDPALRETAVAARSALAESEARVAAGRYPAAIESAERGQALIAEVELPLLEGELLQQLGASKWRMGELDEAEAAYREGLLAAGRAQEHRLVAGILLDVFFIVGVERNKIDEALVLGDLAEVSVLAAGDDAQLRYSYEDRIAMLLRKAGRYSDAEVHHRRAIEVARQAEAGDKTITVLYSNLGNTLYRMGEYAESREVAQTALDAAIRVYGEEHPETAKDWVGLGRACAELGDQACRREAFGKSLDIRRRTLGPDHPEYADSLFNVSSYRRHDGEYAEAEKGIRQAMEIWTKVHGAVSSRMATGYSALSSVARARGDKEAAAEHGEKAVSIGEQVYGPEHPELTTYLTNGGNALHDVGRFEEALRNHRRAVAIGEKEVGPDNGDLIYGLLGQIDALRSMKRPQEALEPAERALALVDAGKVHLPFLAGGAHFGAAQVYWEVGDKERALEQAQKAYAEYAKAQTGDPNAAKKVRAWLEERGATPPLTAG